MTVLTAQILAVEGLLAVLLVYWRLRKHGVRPPPELHFDAGAFRTQISWLPDCSDASDALATAAHDLFDTYRTSVQNLDGKASTLLGFVGGGSSALALLAGTDKIARPAFTPLLVVAVFALAVVFYFSLQCLLPRSRKNVNVEQLCDIAMLRSASGKSRVQALVGLEYLEAARQIVPIVGAKMFCLECAYTAFAVGVLAVVANAFLPVGPPRKALTIPVQCDITGTQILHCSLTTEAKP